MFRGGCWLALDKNCLSLELLVANCFLFTCHDAETGTEGSLGLTNWVVAAFHMLLHWAPSRTEVQ